MNRTLFVSQFLSSTNLNIIPAKCNDTQICSTKNSNILTTYLYTVSLYKSTISQGVMMD